MLIINNIKFFSQIHQSRLKTNITMALILSVLIFVMISTVYYTEQEFNCPHLRHHH